MVGWGPGNGVLWLKGVEGREEDTNDMWMQVEEMWSHKRDSDDEKSHGEAGE